MQTLKQYYKAYCKILTRVIKEAKRMTLSERIFKSNNKIKTTWNIINELLGKQQSTQGIQRLTINGTQLTNQQDIANAINEYFSSITNPESNNENPICNMTTLLYIITINKIREPLLLPWFLNPFLHKK